jgi:hypothetical protein
VIRQAASQQIMLSFIKFSPELTIMRCSKLSVHHGVYYLFHISWQGCTGAIVNGSLVDAIVCCMACLKNVQRSSHVTLGELDQSFFAVPSQIAAEESTSEMSIAAIALQEDVPTHPSLSITWFNRSSTWSSSRGLNRNRVHLDCMAGIILLT